MHRFPHVDTVGSPVSGHCLENTFLPSMKMLTPEPGAVVPQTEI